MIRSFLCKIAGTLKHLLIEPTTRYIEAREMRKLIFSARDDTTVNINHVVEDAFSY